MRRSTVSKTGAGSSSIIVTDTFQVPFAIGMGVVVNGTVNYTVQHTFDDPNGSPTWFNHSTLAAQTANADGNYAYPCTAIKILVNSGSGTATLTAIQAG